MKYIQYVLFASALLFADDFTDIYGLDDYPEAPTEITRAWHIDATLGETSGDNGLGTETLGAGYRAIFHLLGKDITLNPLLSLVRYEMDPALNALEPSLNVNWLSYWSHINVNGWLSYALTEESYYYGMEARALLRAVHWDGGEIQIGPTLTSSNGMGTSTGAIVSVAHLWTYEMMWHGPLVEWESSADLSSTSQTTMRGQRSWMGSTFHIGSASYAFGWNSRSGFLGVESRLGYSYQVALQERMIIGNDATGLWGNATLQVRW
jgi:hypothetical protein